MTAIVTVRKEDSALGGNDCFLTASYRQYVQSQVFLDQATVTVACSLSVRAVAQN